MLSQSCYNAMKPQWNTADVIIPLMGDSLHTGPINHLPLYPLLGLWIPGDEVPSFTIVSFTTCFGDQHYSATHCVFGIWLQNFISLRRNPCLEIFTDCKINNYCFGDQDKQNSSYGSQESTFQGCSVCRWRWDLGSFLVREVSGITAYIIYWKWMVLLPQFLLFSVVNFLYHISSFQRQWAVLRWNSSQQPR